MFNQAHYTVKDIKITHCSVYTCIYTSINMDYHPQHNNKTAFTLVSFWLREKSSIVLLPYRFFSFFFLNQELIYISISRKSIGVRCGSNGQTCDLVMTILTTFSILGLQSISWDMADNVKHPRQLDPTMELITYSFVLYLQHGRHDVKCKPSIALNINRIS